MIRFQQTLLKNYLYISKTFLLYNVNLCFYFFYNDLHVACYNFGSLFNPFSLPEKAIFP